MDMRRSVPIRILRSALFILSAGLLFGYNLSRLWPAVFVLGILLLLSLLQDVWADATRLSWSFLAVRILATALIQLICTGPGVLLLYDLLILDACLAARPAVAALVGAGLWGLSSFGRSADQTEFLQAAFVAAIFFLVWQAKEQRRLLRQRDNHLADLRLAERNLADDNTRLQSESRSLADMARQAERSRISRGIHDTLGHTLTAIMVQLSAALQLLTGQPEGAREKIGNAREAARVGLAGVRATLQQLDEQGQTFRERLHRLVQSAQDNLSVRILALTDQECVPAAAQQDLVLACLKEGLTNGVRHGGATAFVFRLEQDGGRLSFYLEDNGAGCAKLIKGYGLTALEETAGQLGGTFRAECLPEQGFVLRLRLPVGFADIAGAIPADAQEDPRGVPADIHEDPRVIPADAQEDPR